MYEFLDKSVTICYFLGNNKSPVYKEGVINLLDAFKVKS